MPILPNGKIDKKTPTPEEIAAALACLDAYSVAPGVWTARLSTGQTIAITDPATADPYAAAVTVADSLDEDNGADTAELAARIMRVTEHAGLVARYWIAASGDTETYTYADVCRELAEVAFAALVAIESLNGEPAAELARTVARSLARIGGA